MENTGSGGKHGRTIISPNNEVEILLFQIAMKINRRETRFLVKKLTETSREKEIHSNANEPCSGFLLHGAPIFGSNLRVFFSFEKEIMK